MTTLTQCQQQVLDMLISYQKERGFPPTNQEVATMLGYRSVNAAVEHLRALEKKGVITIKRGVARGITLHTTVKDDDSEAVGIIRSLLAGEENARLRATHWRKYILASPKQGAVKRPPSYQREGQGIPERGMCSDH